MDFDHIFKKKIKVTTLFFITKMNKNAISSCKIELIRKYYQKT